VLLKIPLNQKGSVAGAIPVIPIPRSYMGYKRGDYTGYICSGVLGVAGVAVCGTPWLLGFIGNTLKNIGVAATPRADSNTSRCCSA
jgi:hypothetical protein